MGFGGGKLYYIMSNRNLVLRAKKGRARNGKRPKQSKNNQQLVLYKPNQLVRSTRSEGGSGFLTSQVPVSFGTLQANQEATVRMAKSNVCVVRHVEYIADVASLNGSFNAYGYPLNPGVPTVFPWLSIMASNWEKYRFRKLCFLYRAKSATTEAGSVISMVDYDSSDSPPLSKQTMMASNYVDSNTWMSHTYDCLASNLGDTMNYRYVRFGPNPPDTDIKTYDLGRFYIATDGGADINKVGELHVAYEVELKTPQIINSAINNLGSFINSINGSTISIPLGTTSTISSSFPSIVNVGTTAPQTLTLGNVGTYIMDMVVTGTSINTWIAPTIVAGAGALLASYSVINAAATLASYFQVLRVDSLPFTINVPRLTAATVITTGAIRFAPYAYAQLGD